MASDEILDVHRFTRDGGDYTVRCPHCKVLIGVDGDDSSEILDGFYQHNRGSNSECGGHFHVTADARFVREL